MVKLPDLKMKMEHSSLWRNRNFNYIFFTYHNATIHFSSREQFVFEAEFFGMTANYTKPSITCNSVSIQNPSWVLPGHGYFIAWKLEDQIIQRTEL